MKQLSELREKIHVLQNKINSLIEQKDFTDYGMLLDLSRELDILINSYVIKSRNRNMIENKENQS